MRSVNARAVPASSASVIVTRGRGA
jgi:hypothetical protein